MVSYTRIFKDTPLNMKLKIKYDMIFKVAFESIHSAVADTSKTVPGKSWLKFKNRDDQSTTLSILVKNLEPSITINWSKFRPKNEA